MDYNSRFPLLYMMFSWLQSQKIVLIIIVLIYPMVPCGGYFEIQTFTLLLNIFVHTILITG